MNNEKNTKNKGQGFSTHIRIKNKNFKNSC